MILDLIQPCYLVVKSLHMEKLFITDQEFQGADYTLTRLPRGEYEQCTFTGCDFSNSFLDNTIFRECEFLECNLGNANLAHTTSSETTFSKCKMIGLRFELCDSLFMSFSFDHCNLNYCSFYGLTLKNLRLESCMLHETDFSNTNLSGASFNQSDLQRAVFSNTGLERADFPTAYNFSIDPQENKLRKASFSKEGLPGLLDKYGIFIES